MRELERSSPLGLRVAVAGPGRLGRVCAAALRAAGMAVVGPLGRGHDWSTAGLELDVVLLCVPDAAIASLAGAIAPGPVLGHLSGASGLEVLGSRRGFSLHPLMTVAEDADPTVLHGASAALDASDGDARALAERLAAALGLRPVTIAPGDRVAYHAAASIAANFLVTLEAAAERLAVTAGLPRSSLAPLVRVAVENWARLGPERALTGPIARGDESTAARQRAAVSERTPELLALYDALAAATRTLAARGTPRETASC